MFSLQNAKALKAKKEEGNKAFKEGNFEAAYELYSEALTIDPNNIKTNAKLFCNRATVGSKVRKMLGRDATGYVKTVTCTSQHITCIHSQFGTNIFTFSHCVPF